jgi:hypothetical protein
MSPWAGAACFTVAFRDLGHRAVTSEEFPRPGVGQAGGIEGAADGLVRTLASGPTLLITSVEPRIE